MQRLDNLVLGFVDTELTSLHFGVVESLDCGLGLGAVRHLDETEALGLVVEVVGNDPGGKDLAVLLKLLAKLLLVGVVTEVADVDFDNAVGGGPVLRLGAEHLVSATPRAGEITDAEADERSDDELALRGEGGNLTSGF